MDVATLTLTVDPAGVVTGTAKAGAAMERVERQGTSSANALKGAFQGLAAYLSARAFLGAFEAIADKTRESALATARLEGVLRATGNAAGFTAAQLGGLADELSRSTLFDDEQYKNAAASLATFGNVVGPVYERALRLSADLATLQGGDLTSSAQQLGKALEDPIRGMQLLTRAGIALSTAQREAVTEAVRHNQVAQAQGVILDALQGKVGGLAAGAHSGLTGALHDLRTAWDNFLEGLGETPGMAQTVANALALVVDALQGLLLTLAPTMAMVEDALSEERTRRRAQLTEFVTRTGPRNVASGQTSQADYLAEVQRLSNELEGVNARYEAIRRSAVDAMHAGTAAAVAARGRILAVVHDGAAALTEAQKAANAILVIPDLPSRTSAVVALVDRLAESKRITDATSAASAAAAINATAMAQAFEAAAAAAKHANAEQSELAKTIKGMPKDPGGGGGGGFFDIGSPLELLQSATGISSVAGVIGKLTDALFGAGDAAERAAEAERQLARARAYYDTVAGKAASLGVSVYSTFDANRQRAILLRPVTPLEAELAKSADEYQRMTEAARSAGLSAGQLAEQLAIINALRKLEADQIRAEFARRSREQREDYGVRELRARGLTDEAAALELAYRQQREYEQAVRDGADAQTLAALASAQYAEKLKAAGDKIRATIDGLKSTLAGLAAFQTSLKFGAGSTASPTQQLAAARAEYDKVLAAAMGGDQTAAGRLPEVARAFLDISRQVNASGMAYQRDLQDVQAAVDAVTALFEGQLDAQQRMLDALGEDGPIVGTLLRTSADNIAVLVAGFSEQTSRLERLIVAVEDGNGKVARALEGAGLRN